MRRRLPELLLLAASLALSALLLEAGARLLIFGPQGLSYARMKSVREIGRSGALRSAEAPGLAFELRPRLDMLHKMAPLRTNDRGLRDGPHPMEPPTGARRILVLGDSFTMASGVSIDQTWHSPLMFALDELHPGHAHERVNLAVAGYQLAQYGAALEAKGLRYRPDLVLVGFCASNDHLVPEGDRPPSFEPRPEGNGFLHSWSLDLARQTWAQIKGGLGYGDLAERARLMRESGLSAAEKRHVAAQFRRLGRLGRRAGSPVAIVYLWHGHRADRWADDVGEAATAAGLGFIDTSPAFADTSMADFALNLVDGHPNAEAHATYARAVARSLDEALRSVGAGSPAAGR